MHYGQKETIPLRSCSVRHHSKIKVAQATIFAGQQIAAIYKVTIRMRV
jgi:hypothetical protein